MSYQIDYNEIVRIARRNRRNSEVMGCIAELADKIALQTKRIAELECELAAKNAVILYIAGKL